MNTQWVSTVDDDGVLLLPEDMLLQLDWQEGDILDFDIRGNGSVLVRNITSEKRKQIFSILKKNTNE